MHRGEFRGIAYQGAHERRDWVYMAGTETGIARRSIVSALPCLLYYGLWRRGRDLNPRGSSPTRFPIVRTRPGYATSPNPSHYSTATYFNQMLAA
jgi:hypothetical protein